MSLVALVPDWLRDADEEERTELEALDLDLQRPMGDAQLQAAASDVMRLLAGAEAQQTRFEAARRAEIERVNARYDRILAPIGKRIEWLRLQAIEIARRISYPKGKKSVKTANGTVGYTTSAAKLVVSHDETLIAWAREQRPDLVRCTVQLSEAELKEFFTDSELETRVKKREVLVSELRKAMGPVAEIPETPPGTSIEPESTEFYAKPDAAAEGA